MACGSTITDDGEGIVDESRGSGLAGLRDRVEALGGELTVTGGAGGVSVTAFVPAAPVEPRAADGRLRHPPPAGRPQTTPALTAMATASARVWAPNFRSTFWTCDLMVSLLSTSRVGDVRREVAGRDHREDLELARAGEGEGRVALVPDRAAAGRRPRWPRRRRRRGRDRTTVPVAPARCGAFVHAGDGQRGHDQHRRRDAGGAEAPDELEARCRRRGPGRSTEHGRVARGISSARPRRIEVARPQTRKARV